MLSTRPYLEYSETEHRYFVDGREKPSVTQILDKAGLVSQFCKDEDARGRGVMVHDLTAKDDQGPLDLRQVPGKLRGYIRAWRKYKSDVGLRIVDIEQRVDSEGYAGRYDRLCFLSGDWMAHVLDIKTGAIPDYARLQLIAYAHAIAPNRLFGRIAVALKPDGTYTSRPYSVGEFYIDRAEWFGLLRQFKETGNGHS